MALTKKEESKKLDEEWFVSVTEKLANHSDTYFELDFSDVEYISFDYTLKLYLLINDLVKRTLKVVLKFEGVGPQERQIIGIDEFVEIRSNGTRTQKTDAQFIKAFKVYRLISFLNAYNFFRSLDNLKKLDKVTFFGIDSVMLEKLHIYEGLGFKTLPILPVSQRTVTQSTTDKLNVLQELRTDTTIENWFNMIETYLDHPIFYDREFNRVIAYQLTLNIVEHVLPQDRKLDEWASGAVCMRLIEQNDFHKFYSNYTSIQSESNAILEICVGDTGQGIVPNLKNKLASILGPKEPRFAKADTLSFQEKYKY